MGCRPSVPEQNHSIERVSGHAHSGRSRQQPEQQSAQVPQVFHEGQRVQARWRGTWYDGRIQCVRGGSPPCYIVAWGTFNALDSFTADGTTTYVEAHDIRPVQRARARSSAATATQAAPGANRLSLATNDQAALPYNWERCLTDRGRTYFKDHSSRATHWNFNPSLVLPPPSAARSAYYTGWQLGDLCEINFRGSWYSGVVVGVQRSATAQGTSHAGVFDVLFDRPPPDARSWAARPGAREAVSAGGAFCNWSELYTAASASCGGGSDSVAERLVPSIAPWHLRFPRKSLGVKGIALFRRASSEGSDDCAGGGGSDRSGGGTDSKSKLRKCADIAISQGLNGPSQNQTIAAMRAAGQSVLLAGFDFTYAASHKLLKSMGMDHPDLSVAMAAMNAVCSEPQLCASRSMSLVQRAVDFILNGSASKRSDWCRATNALHTAFTVNARRRGAPPPKAASPGFAVARPTLFAHSGRYADAPSPARGVRVAENAVNSLNVLTQRWHSKWEQHAFVRRVLPSGHIGWHYERDPTKFDHLRHMSDEVRRRRQLSFESKRRAFVQQCASINEAYDRNRMQTLNVRPGHELEDVMDAVHALGTTEFRQVWRTRFVGSQGIDAGGLTRTLFLKLSQQIFDRDRGAFVFSGLDNVCYQINPAASRDFVPPPTRTAPRTAEGFFFFVGRMIAKALLSRQIIQARFARPLYKHFVGECVKFEDLEQLDPSTHRSLRFILNYPKDGTIDDMLCQTFTDENFLTATGVDDVPLVPGGAEIPVTDVNKEEYVFLKMRRVLLGRIEPHLEVLLRGFFDVIPEELIAPFAPHELAKMIAGESTINVAEWQRHCNYRGGVDANSRLVRWWWDIITEFSNEQRQKVLEFVTGSQWVPPGGFSALQGRLGENHPFCINCTPYDEFNVLPRAHTCFNRIDLPDYPSKTMMKQQLTLVIEMEHSYDMD